MSSPAAVATRIAPPERLPAGVRRFEAGDVPAVVQLWTRCFPLSEAIRAALAHFAA